MSQYYVSYSGGHLVEADSEEEACEIGMDEMKINEVNAYSVNENEEIEM